MGGETLGFPNWFPFPQQNIWGVLLPGDAGCEFGPCIPGVGGFQAQAIPLGAACLSNPVCATALVLTTAAVVYWPQIVQFARRADKVTGNPTLDQLQSKCQAKPLIDQPSRTYPGGTSREQEFVCTTGTWTAHWLWDARGKLKKFSIRPGPPRYGQD